MVDNHSKTNGEPKFSKTLLDDLKTFFKDLRGGELKRTLGQDFYELKEFYLDEERKNRLKAMGRFRRWIYMTTWLLKSLFMKLTPVRRILLLISLLFLIASRNIIYGDSNINVSINFNVAAILMLLFILMLELRDKLLARSELEAGRSVQRALMPDKSPNVPGWSLWLFTRPANEVGGDVVDFQQITSNRFGVALGDVAGKGLGAALFMAKLQAILRALAPDFTSLSELGAKINEIFYRDGIPKNFASLVYLELQSTSDFVRVLNAGHMPPIALRGTTIKEMPKGAPALGISPKAIYTEQHIELEKGDYLLVYSDGLTEARNESGDFFGDQRLLELLPKLDGITTDKFGERLIADVDQFVGNARANDDLSLVVLRRLS